eukprot:2309757-Pleurochrysis_carterae.AAC.2
MPQTPRDRMVSTIPSCPLVATCIYLHSTAKGDHGRKASKVEKKGRPDCLWLETSLPVLQVGWSPKGEVLAQPFGKSLSPSARIGARVAYRPALIRRICRIGTAGLQHRFTLHSAKWPWKKRQPMHGNAGD